jgi:small subunit ribosomal protein S4
MSRYTGPKQRLQRQIGEDLGLKTSGLKTAKRVAVRPGQHGAKNRRKISNFGVQLKEKQKIKYIYGVMEKQLRKLYELASKNPAATGSALLAFLERRLDNVVYRLDWAPTRASARQLVNHSHLTVNGKKMNIPSYQVKVGDVLAEEKTMKIPVVAALLAAERNLYQAG